MKNIIIIGGSKGISSALVENLKNDYHLHLLCRSEISFNESNITTHVFDVLKDEFPVIDGEIKALIYCPGSVNLKPFHRISEEGFLSDFQINVVGAIKAIQFYLKALKKSSNPSVIMFSSVAVRMGMGFHSSVGVSKGAIEGLVKSLAAEFAPRIRVNAVAPTLTDTPLVKHILKDDESFERMRERHPLKEILSADEVAAMVNFLISDNSRSISGQVFDMDYGIVHIKK